MPTSRPNIFYIHSHDSGRYISPYGHRLRTPNMQRFAEEGALFHQAFCNNPTCAPSRACLLTGRYAHNNGMLGLAHRGWRLNDYTQHITHTLKDAGYRTALCGFQHLTDWNDPQRNLAYDDHVEAPKIADQRAARACEYIRQFAKNNDQAEQTQPLFMSVGFTQTHRPFPDHAPEDDPRYLPTAAALPDAPQTREDFADFATLVHRLDAAIGQVLTTLDRTGLAEDTLVILTTDHGIAFPAMKCNLTDHGLGVMLMMRGPTSGPGSELRGGRVVEPMTQHLDLFPTICELAHITPPGWLQGKSLLPLVRGELDTLHHEVFGEVNYHAAYEPKRCVRTERYKYIRRFHDTDRPVLANCDASISKAFWLDRGWANQRIDREYLFDLAFDPNETANLVNDPDYESALDQMRCRLDRWMQRTDDPILRGPIPLPEGGQANTHAQDEPKEPTLCAAEFDPNRP